MIPSNAAFNGNSSYEFDGKPFYRWHHLRKSNDYQLILRIVSTNSINQQGIALFFSEFEGKLFLNGNPLPVLKAPFQHYVFKEGEIPNNECVLTVRVEKGHLFIANASQETEGTAIKCGAYGCAFWIESISDNHFRFHCNDHEYDDDFDDLIFDMEVFDLPDVC